MRLLTLLRARRTALFLSVVILTVGGVSLGLRLPASIFPAVTFPIVKVIADVGEEPAARMMPTVTRPLEEAVLRVPGVQRVLSTSSRGSSELSAQFSWGTDMQVALQRVRAEIERVRPDLPAEAKIETEWMNTAVFPILGYALTSDTKSQAALWELARYAMKPELVSIPGVSQVQIQGGRQREFQIRLDTAALAGHRLTPSDVVDAIRSNDFVDSAGLVESNHELYLSLVTGRAEGIDSLSSLAIISPGGGAPVRLGQLGQIEVADAISYIRTTAGGRPAVLVNIIRQPSANTVEIARRIADLFRERKELNPPGVHLTCFYDQAKFVSDSVYGVRDAILVGMALAGLVLFVFLRSLRVTLLAVAVLPVSVALVLLGLAAAGQTVNLMTLGGIAAALGLVADDVIVVVENIFRHRDERGSADPVSSGLTQILSPLVGSSLSTIVVFLPFAFIAGVVGAFFKPLALTMALSLAISFFLAAFVVPIALGHMGGASPAQRREGTRFSKAVRGLERRAWLSLALLVGLLVGAFLLFRTIGTDFLPEMDEGSIILDYWTPPGTSLTDTDAILREAEKIIMNVRDVESYSRRTGTQLGFFITEPNRGDYVIKLKPRNQRRPVDEVVNDLRTRLNAVEPAIHTDFGQLIEDNISDLTGGVPQPVDVRIFGEDQALLQKQARLAAHVIRGIRGTEDVFDGIVVAGPALEIRGKPQELARAGLTLRNLHAAVEPALTGTVAGDVRLGERLYPIRVFAGNPGGLEGLRVRTAAGSALSVRDLAAVTTGAPEAEIDRENLKTYLGVTARLSGRDLGGAIAEIRRKLEAQAPLPPGMSLRFGGLYEQQQSSFKALLSVLIGGIFLVAVIVLFEFGDWRAPLLTSLCSLSVLAGVFAALIGVGMTFNISSFVGAIMMVGIVGENAIFVIHEARLQLLEGLPVREAWAAAAGRRLRPVVMTILATAFALAPLALAFGEGSQLQQPLAVAVIGGFVLSGFVVLLLLPALYSVLDPKGELGRA
jgi:CzcA family heavy metal efflux pump